MNIVLFYNNLPSGGVCRVICEICKRLLERGHRLTCYNPEKNATVSSFLKRYGATVISHGAPSYFNALAIRPYFLNPWAAAGIFLKRSLLYDHLCRQLAHQIDAASFDVAWIEKCCFVSSTFLLKHLRTTKVYYCQEPWRDAYEGQAHLAGYKLCGVTGKLAAWGENCKLNLRRIIDRKNACSADMILANSKYSQGYIAKAYGVSSEVCYLGVDNEFFHPMSLERKNFILSVGRIEKRKRHDLLIESLGHMPEKNRPQAVVVASRDSSARRLELEALAREHGVHLIIKLGISDGELVQLYNEATCVFYGAMREPFGLVALEAMACGTPIIAVREGGLQESVVDGKTGFLVNPEPEDCADAIRKIFADQNLQGKFSEAGIKHVASSWTWDHAATRFENYLYDAVNEQMQKKSNKGIKCK